jgi:hypothetical protein
MLRSVVFLLFVLLFGLSVQGQGPVNRDVIEGGSSSNVIYRKDHSGQVYLHTRGFGFLYRMGKHVTAKQRNYFELDFTNIRHPKEVQVVGTAFDRKRFVYGKLYNVILLKAAIGSQNVFYHKADLEAVEVRYSYSIGPGITFLKPYYVQVDRVQYSNVTTEEVPFNEDTFTIDSIKGRASFFKGFSSLVVLPVITGKFNVSFEYAHYTNIIRALELGLCVDYFPIALSSMARNPSENFVVTLRLGFVFGRKQY